MLLILGSGSPRRREILTSLRVPFEVCVADADETVGPNESPASYLPRVVRAKLAAVRARLSPELAARASAILVADTSVVLGARILGKPDDAAHARDMIAQLSGCTHEVHTRFALASVRDDDATKGAAAGATVAALQHEETVVTRVTFRTLAADEIAAYAASGEGADKAGGYAVQGLGASLVSRIEGSYGAVVGLPAAEVVVALRRLALTGTY